MTYSIVARDPVTGALGVAVQSHYFGVGRVVAWAEAGVGAVATQSLPEVAYGPRGLDLMRAGVGAPEALRRLVGADVMEGMRQVAMVDAAGEVAVHTGKGCIAEAGHATGGAVSVQANMMARATVPAAMMRAYEATKGRDLADRLLAALDAAEAEGGDVRGKQSAAMLVVAGERSDAPWDRKLVDLRVDDHPEPLAELRRLLATSRAHDRLGAIFASGILFREITAADPEVERVLAELAAIQHALGENAEPTFWSAVVLAKAGRTDDARAAIERASASNAGWAELLVRLASAGIAPPSVAEIVRRRG